MSSTLEAIAESVRVSEAISAGFVERLSPTLKALAESDALKARFRAPTSLALKALAEDFPVWEQLSAGADLFASVGIAEVLREEASGLVEDPAAWLDEIEDAAQAGDDQAVSVLFLLRYLFGCFLLLAQRLNPSAKTIEKAGALVALSVLMTVVVGTTYANSPKTLEKWNTCLGTPLGILGVYLAISSPGGKRPRRQKPSLNRRGNSKPRTKMLRRFRHR